MRPRRQILPLQVWSTFQPRSVSTWWLSGQTSCSSGFASPQDTHTRKGSCGLPGLDLQQSQGCQLAVGQIGGLAAVATRYEKVASSFMRILCLAATLERIKR